MGMNTFIYQLETMEEIEHLFTLNAGAIHPRVIELNIGKFKWNGIRSTYNLLV